MLQQRFWRSLCIGLSAVLLVVPSVFIRAKAETSTLGYWVVTAEAAGLNDQAQTMYNYVLHIYTMHDDARGNVSGTYSTMGGNNQSFSNVVFYGKETTVNLYSGATNTIGNTIRGNGTFSYVYTGEETVIEFSQDQWAEITQHFNDMATAMGNIDNLLDTISWIDDNVQPLQYSTTFNGTLSSSTGNTGVSTIYVPISIPQTLRQTGTLYHYKLRIDSTVSGVNGNVYVTLSHALSNGDRTVVPANIYVLHNRQTVDIFIFDTYLYWENNILEITTEKGNVHVYNTNTLFFQYLPNTDIEYWHLLYYLSELHGNTVIINNQQTVINQQNQNNEYNQQQYNTDNNEEQTDDIEGFMVDYDNKLGFIGQSFEFITSLFSVITNADASTTIPFPGVTVPIGEGGSNVTLIQAQNVDIVPSGLSSIFEYVRLANSMIIVSAVFNMAINKYKEWSMK